MNMKIDRTKWLYTWRRKRNDVWRDIRIKIPELSKWGLPRGESWPPYMTKFPNYYLMEEVGVGLAVLYVRCEVLNSCWDSGSLQLVVHPSRGEKDSSYRRMMKDDRLWGWWWCRSWLMFSVSITWAGSPLATSSWVQLVRMMVMQIMIGSVPNLKYLRRIASGDIFMRLSSCSPPSSRLARPGHCSRLIWLNKPILGEFEFWFLPWTFLFFW